jgi:hypothetical protein
MVVRRRGSQMAVRLSKLSFLQAVEAQTIVKRRGSHIFYTIGSQMG